MLPLHDVLSICVTIFYPQYQYQTGLCKQWRPRSDAAECSIWSGSTLFAKQSFLDIEIGNKLDCSDLRASKVRSSEVQNFRINIVILCLSGLNQSGGNNTISCHFCTLTLPWKCSSQLQLMIFLFFILLFFRENKAGHFIWIICQILFSLKNTKKKKKKKKKECHLLQFCLML